MNPSDHSEPDPLAELLAVPSEPTDAEKFRHAVFARTTGVMRRRRIVRRVASTAAMAACYAAGIATMSLFSGDRGDHQPIVIRQADPEVSPAPDESPRLADAAGSAAAPPQTEEPAPPPKSRFEFFRNAGDHQLFERGNMQAAVRLYARALDVASPAELAISTDSDNWLLMSLKQSRLQEIRNVDDKI